MTENDLSRRTVLKTAAWSLPIITLAATAPAAAASTDSLVFTFGSPTSEATLLYPGGPTVPADRMHNAVLYSALYVQATETNTTDLTVQFGVGQSASGHTNYRLRIL